MLKRNILVLLATASLLIAQLSNAQVTNFIPKKYQPQPHPRLFLLKGEEEMLKKSIDIDPLKLKIHNSILKSADEMLTTTPIERKLDGRRLLARANKFYNRVFFLSYAYRLTKDEKYAKRAELEMLTVADFSDWNPSHFLDVAEMTIGMSIGYDWLFDFLPESSRTKIKNSIINLGINPSLDESKHFWMKGNNNWNQVCHSAMTLGALAVFEDEKSLATDIINRSISYVPYSMKVYAPDGAYPEGYGYWTYGTGYNVVLLSVLDKAFGTDFELSKQPGFLRTGDYMLNMVGTSNLPFNYADCGSGPAGFTPGLIWFAAKLKDTGLLFNAINSLNQTPEKSAGGDKLMPYTLIWSINIPFAKVEQPKNLIYVAQGETPVATLRTGWDNKSIFVGLKCGSPFTNHGHMDVGSFVVDANGVRWGLDLGMEDYNSLETNGIKYLFSPANKETGRWTILRHNNFHHNTLSFDSTLQNVPGRASITGFNDNPNNLSATTDLTSLYSPLVQSVERTVAIVNKEKVTVKDVVTNSNKITKVKWTFMTNASVTVINEKQLELNIKDKKLVITLDFKGKSKTFVKDATPTNSFEKANPNVKVIGFDIELTPNETTNWTVSLVPSK